MEYVSPRESMAKINAGGRAEGLTNTQNDFRSMLSFWESMVIHNRQRMCDYQGGTTRANSVLPRKTVVLNQCQEQATEGTGICLSRVHSVLLSSLYEKKAWMLCCHLDTTASMRLLCRMREVDMKSRKRNVAHMNGKKIQAIVKYYSDTWYG